MDSAGRIFKAIQCESELAYLADTTVSLADIYREFGAVFEYDDNLFIGDAYDLIAAVLCFIARLTFPIISTAEQIMFTLTKNLTLCQRGL